MVCDELKELFPKYDKMCYVSDNAEVIEVGGNAKVKKVIWKDGGCQICDPLLIKDLTAFFQLSESKSILHKHCDGILIFDGSEGKRNLVFCELKSSFDTKELYRGYQQIISSCIKMKLLLNLLPNYTYDDYEVKGFIFSKPKKKGLLRDLYKQSLLPKQSQNNKEANFILKLCTKENKPYVVQPADHGVLDEVPLGKNVLFSTMELYHIEVPQENGICEIYVSDYIK